MSTYNTQHVIYYKRYEHTYSKLLRSAMSYGMIQYTTTYDHTNNYNATHTNTIARGKLLRTRNRHLRNHHGLSVALSNGCSVTCSKNIIVTCQRQFPNDCQLSGGFHWKSPMDFSGMFQWHFTCVISGV